MAEREFKEAFGLRIYKDGNIENLNSGRKVGYVNNSGELAVYVPEKKDVYKISIIMIAVWKNNGILPEKPKTWKIIYRDGNFMNCAIDNLDYIDTAKDVYIFKPSELKSKISILKAEKSSLKKRLDEIDDELLKLTSELASKTRESRYEKIKTLKEDIKKNKEAGIVDNRKIVSNNIGRPKGHMPLYLVDRYSQNYEYLPLEDIVNKLGISKSFILKYASKSTIIPNNPRYAVTRNLGDIWELMR